MAQAAPAQQETLWAAAEDLYDVLEAAPARDATTSAAGAVLAQARRQLEAQDVADFSVQQWCTKQVCTLSGLAHADVVPTLLRVAADGAMTWHPCPGDTGDARWVAFLLLLCDVGGAPIHVDVCADAPCTDNAWAVQAKGLVVLSDAAALDGGRQGLPLVNPLGTMICGATRRGFVVLCPEALWGNDTAWRADVIQTEAEEEEDAGTDENVPP